MTAFWTHKLGNGKSQKAWAQGCSSHTGFEILSKALTLLSLNLTHMQIDTKCLPHKFWGLNETTYGQHTVNCKMLNKYKVLLFACTLLSCISIIMDVLLGPSYCHKHPTFPNIALFLFMSNIFPEARNSHLLKKTWAGPWYSGNFPLFLPWKYFMSGSIYSIRLLIQDLLCF